MTTRKTSASETPDLHRGDRSILGRLWCFVSPQYALILLAFLVIPVTAIIEVAQPFLLGVVIDTYITHHIAGGLPTAITIWIGLVAAQSLLGYLHKYCLFLAGQRFMHSLRETTYRHILSRRTAFFDRVSVGRLLAVSDDIECINSVFTFGVITMIVGDVVRMLAVLAMMLYLDAELTLMTLITIPLVVIMVRSVRKWLRDTYRRLRTQFAVINELLQEHLNGLPILQVFRREDVTVAEFEKLNRVHLRTFRSRVLGEITMIASVRAIGIISVAIIVWYSGSSFGEGTMTIGLVVIFIAYIKKFFEPIVQFSVKYAIFQMALAGAERVVGILDNQEDDAPVRTVNDQDRRSDTGDAIEFRDVHFRYRAGEPVLRGLDLQVKPGQKVAVVGATGSGKSTIIKLLTRLYEIDSGNIFYRDQNILEIEVSELRRQIVVVNQDIFLFEGSVRDNVRIGRTGATDQEVDRALEQVGASDLLLRRGEDEKALLTKRGENLSVGERQLVAFARALIRNPEILILDEATAHIDPTTEGIIGDALDVLMEGRTSLVIAHRLSTIRDADKIVVLDRGAIAEQGTYEALIRQGGLFAKLESSFSRES